MRRDYSDFTMKPIYDYKDWYCDIWGRIIHNKKPRGTDKMDPTKPYGCQKTAMVKIYGTQYSVGRIIVDHFIPMPEGYDPKALQVYHLNGLPDDNSVENLVWATLSEIMQMEHVGINERRAWLEEFRKAC